MSRPTASSATSPPGSARPPRRGRPTTPTTSSGRPRARGSGLRWTFPERWLPMSVITFGRVNLRPVPWRTVGLLAVLALLLAVAAAVYVGSQPQRLPPPFGAAANGLVAYSKDGDIYTVDPITSARRAIVAGTTVDESPSFSLDGTRLAFARTVGNGRVIVVADADGRNQVEIPMTPMAEVSHPAWSPDGRWIAVTSGDGELWIVDTAAKKAQMVNGLVLDDEALLWRPPDGRQVAVVARESLLNRLRFALVTPGVDKQEFLAPVGYLGSQFRAGGWTPRREPIRLRLGSSLGTGSCCRGRQRARCPDPAEHSGKRHDLPAVVERRSTCPVHGTGRQR